MVSVHRIFDMDSDEGIERKRILYNLSDAHNECSTVIMDTVSHQNQSGKGKCLGISEEIFVDSPSQ